VVRDEEVAPAAIVGVGLVIAGAVLASRKEPVPALRSTGKWTQGDPNP